MILYRVVLIVLSISQNQMTSDGLGKGAKGVVPGVGGNGARGKAAKGKECQVGKGAKGKRCQVGKGA